MTEMDKRGIIQYLGTTVIEITKAGVKAKKDGKEIIIPADTCVFSFGMTPNADILKTVQSLAGSIPVYMVGDCEKSGKLGDAVRSGHMAALQIV